MACKYVLCGFRGEGLVVILRSADFPKSLGFPAAFPW